MQVPLELSFRWVEKTEYLEQLIREQVAKVERVCPKVTSCRIVVEKPSEFQASGSPYRVRIEVKVPPGHTLVSRHEPGEGELHDALPALLRRCFTAVRRQARKLEQRKHAEVKVHPTQQASAFVARLFREEGYGFLRTVEGREVYFHRNSVIHRDFDRLTIGTGVTFEEQPGEKGPQASTVQVVDKPGRTTGEDEALDAREIDLLLNRRV